MHLSTLHSTPIHVMLGTLRHIPDFGKGQINTQKAECQYDANSREHTEACIQRLGNIDFLISEFGCITRSSAA